MRLVIVLVVVTGCSRDTPRGSELDTVLARTAAGAPGLTVIVEQRGEIILDRAYGLADLELDAPAMQDTVMPIGSISKQFGAAAVMQLVEAGKLHIDDALAIYLPTFPRADRITIRDLLRHTSGIADFEYDGVWPTTMAVARSAEDMVATFRDMPPLFEPGTQWSYSSSNYVLLDLIIQKVSGETLARYLQTHVFDRAGLTSTRICAADQLIPRRAKGYDRKQTGWVPAPPALLTPFVLAGGICSTSRDLLHWQHALEEGRVVSADSYRQMVTPGTLVDGTPLGYGFGLFAGSTAGHPVVGHSGGVPGFSSMLSHYMDEDLRIATLVNTRDARGPAFPIAAVELSFGQASAVPIPAAELAAFTSTFPFTPYEFRFAPDRDQLAFTVFEHGVAQGPPTPMVHVGHDTFESPDRDVRVMFTRTQGVTTAGELSLGEMTIRTRIAPRN